MEGNLEIDVKQILSINVYLLKKRLSIKEMVMFPQREYSKLLRIVRRNL